MNKTDFVLATMHRSGRELLSNPTYVAASTIGPVIMHKFPWFTLSLQRCLTQRPGNVSTRNRLRKLMLGKASNSARSRLPTQLFLEHLEKRQVMAGDTDVFLSSPTEARDDMRTPGLISHAIPEGEAATDLVAFAKALADAGVVFYAAAWCPFCTEQK